MMYLLWVVGFGLHCMGLAVTPAPQWNGEKQVIYSTRAAEKPTIDGVLDDEAWRAEPLQKDFITFLPVYGEVLPCNTLVWTSYDSENIYFAFKCDDPEPQKIKASYSKRDDIFSDDWVCISLDSLRNVQSGYAFMINPYGIQADALDSAVSGGDLAPDFVWKSAGRLTEEGYQVEVRIPLQTIRFKGGRQVRMGIVFIRHISRLGIEGSWPRREPGQGLLNSHTSIIYQDLQKPLRLEVLPSITHHRNNDRENSLEWGKENRETEFGFGLKYGITSSITCDITVNPDFSQVESDAFQVEVNQRYPLFYSEKRPFFMEGIDKFHFFTGPYGYFHRAVHTRRIANPRWGLKLTGTVGKAAFGILSAQDVLPDQQNGERNAFFGIARGKYSLGQDNYMGFLYSGREYGDRYNRVFGVDLGFRLKMKHKFNASFLYSMSDYDDSPGNKNLQASNFNLSYVYETRPLVIDANFEHIDPDFNIDSGFLVRRGIDQGIVFLHYNIYPDPKKLNWLKRIRSSLLVYYVHDLDNQADDYYIYPGVSCNFIKQGYLSIQLKLIKERWQGQDFKMKRLLSSGNIQLTRWLYLDGMIGCGEKIYYEGQPAFKGESLDSSISLVFQPTRNFNHEFSYTHSDLSKDGEKLYDVNIFFSSSTYQFNKYFFLRANLQYNSYEKRLLTDFLASFTLIPGTVLHVGYGGIYENREWQGNDWVYRQGDLVNIKRSLFFKASYLWRF